GGWKNPRNSWRFQVFQIMPLREIMVRSITLDSRIALRARLPERFSALSADWEYQFVNYLTRRRVNKSDSSAGESKPIHSFVATPALSTSINVGVPFIFKFAAAIDCLVSSTVICA